MYRKNDLIIIIPTYNEVGNIENIVKRIYDVLKEINFKIYLTIMLLFMKK